MGKFLLMILIMSNNSKIRIKDLVVFFTSLSVLKIQSTTRQGSMILLILAASPNSKTSAHPAKYHTRNAVTKH